MKRGNTTIHGGSGKPEYSSWLSMRWRCYSRKSKDWARYGGRGIKVCRRWLGKKTGFLNFLADMGPRPPGFTLERRYGNRNYTPNNCRWASRQEQSRNRVTAKMITYNGRTMSLTDWSEEIGIGVDTLCRRMKSHLSVSEALTRPLRSRRPSR